MLVTIHRQRSSKRVILGHVLTFAEEIGLVPIPIRKEQNGYIINSLLVQ